MAIRCPLGKKSEFKKKPTLALELIEKSLNRGYRPGIVLIDSAYGNNTSFLRKLEEKNLKYIGGIAKNRNLLFKTSSGRLDTIRIDEYVQWISDEEFQEIQIQGTKPRTVWVAIIEVEISRLEGQRKIAIVMNAPVFEEAEDIDYLLIEKRIWMQQGDNTTYIQYKMLRGSKSLSLSLKALVNYRDRHSTTESTNLNYEITNQKQGIKIKASSDAVDLCLSGFKNQEIIAWEINHEWYKNFALAIEKYRGLNHIEDHLYAGNCRVNLELGESVTIVASAEDWGREGSRRLED